MHLSFLLRQILLVALPLMLVRAAEPPKPATSGLAGIVVDDSDAQYTGAWVESTKQANYVGNGYRHDNHEKAGTKSARFTPKLTEPGAYEVRLIYSATNNRATNAQVTVEDATGGKVVKVNQREDCMEKEVPKSLGDFKFQPGKPFSVTLSNANADGFVVVDAVQFVPIAVADAERAGQRPSGFALVEAKPTAAAPKDKLTDQRNQMAAAVAVSPLAKKTIEGRVIAAPSTEKVNLANAVSPQDINGNSYDLIVVGATAGGVACAVRAARDGCTVLLVQHNRHIGGMLSNGLMQWDALYGGPRAPLFTELLRNIEKDAIARYGQDSKAHQTVRFTHQHYPVGWVESHVMERECNRLVAGERNITLLLEHYAVAVERDGAVIKDATLRAYGTTNDITVKAAMFADGTYEGDLFALAKVPYRVGREARDEYHEPHAGKIFVNIAHGPPENVIPQGLNIRPYGSHQGGVDPSSPFTADNASQAYNYRFCVTKNPDNRLMLTEPPSGYNREEYVNYDRKSIATNGGPNLKSHMNSPILPGENHAYPEASWPEREKIISRHKDFGLGLIWFLQNDKSVSEAKRAEYREWGLAKDEFPDNGHVPYEMYVREARRIVGRYLLTEHDGVLATGYARTPIHEDSIAGTDWYMDSHSCTMDSKPGFKYDGKLILTEESRPMQIPYRALLTQGVDNLLVPVCLSSTHVAWGAIRLEPVWMQTGEAAGVAAALAKRERTTPAQLNQDLLLRTLVTRRHLVSFFNDIKVDAEDPRIPAAEYFATKGFFHDYNARLDEPLKSSTAKIWTEAFADLRKGKLDAAATARAVAASEQAASDDHEASTRGDILLKLWQQLSQE
jgi:hypothetical protein